MDINLETLKTEILDYLAASDFGVFRSHPGALEGIPVVAWDTETFPDYRMFLEAAQRAGQKLILFASREFEEDEVLEALEEIEGIPSSSTPAARNEIRDYESRVRAARRYVGSFCTLELAFDYNSHLYVYEVRPDWYDEFLETCEEITTLFAGGEDGEEDTNDNLGGFYSNN